MKSRLILLILPMVLLLGSCFEDQSNTQIKALNPIVIDMGGASTALSAYSLDIVEIQPLIYKIGTDDARLSFRWELTTHDGIAMVLGEKMSLRAVVPVPPASDPYPIILTVTDEDTGLQSYMSFSIAVMSAMGKGLLIADTRDGVNSDLNLIMAKEFTQGSQPFDDKNTKVTYGIYSTINGDPLDGLVTGMNSNVETRQADCPRTLTVITPKHAYRMDPYEYELQMLDEEMFYVGEIFKDKPFTPMHVGYADMPKYDVMIVDGTLYSRNSQWGEAVHYGVGLETTPLSDYYLTMGTDFVTGGARSAMCYYDEKNSRFLRSNGSQSGLYPMDGYTQPGAPFNLNNLGDDFRPLFMGAGINYFLEPYWDPYTIFAVMESKTDNKRYLFTFKSGINGATDLDYEPLGKYDMSAFPDFDKSVAWECSPLENILYYATPDKVYALNLSSGTPTATERYAAAQGEVITGMMLWRYTSQGKMWFKAPGGSDRTLDVNGNRMMIIASYNESAQEGKVTCVPIMNVGSGTFETDKNFHVTFDGFGRIVCMAHQPV